MNPPEYYQLWPPHEPRGDHVWVLIAIDSVGQSRWVADRETGPFTTNVEVGRWLTKAVALDMRQWTELSR